MSDDLLYDLAFVTAHDKKLLQEAESVASPIADDMSMDFSSGASSGAGFGASLGADSDFGSEADPDSSDENPARMAPDKKQMIADYLLSRAQKRADDSKEYQTRTLKSNMGAK